MTFRLLSPAPAAALAMATIATAAAFDIDASLTLSDPSHIVTVGEDAMIQNDINAASPVIPHDSSATSKEAAVHSLRLKNTDEDDRRVLKYRPKNLRLTAAVSSYDSSKELGILHGTPAQSSFDSYSDGFGVGVRHRELFGGYTCDDDERKVFIGIYPLGGSIIGGINKCVKCDVEVDETDETNFGTGTLSPSLQTTDLYANFFECSTTSYCNTELPVEPEIILVDPLTIKFTVPCIPSSMPSMNPAMPSKAAKKTKAPKAPKAAKGTKAPKAE